MKENAQNIRPIYIALGGNLSNQKVNFIKALELMATRGIQILARSGLWQSPSWPPGQGHPDYLNAVVKVSFDESPEVLLTILQDVEQTLGRKRTVRNAPRTLDLDIVDFKGQIFENSRLTLPHPRLRERGFVLFPLSQITPNWTDPVTGHTLDYFIARLPMDDVKPMQYRGRF